MLNKWFGKRNAVTVSQAKSTKTGGRITSPSAMRTHQLEMLEDRCVPALLAGQIVDITQAANSESELSLAINPANPQNMIMGPNTFTDNNDDVWVTLDGGSNWQPVAIPTPGGQSGGGDPAVAFDKNGRAVYTHLMSDGGLGAALSTDGGLTWTASEISPAGNGFSDKEYVTAGPDFQNLTQDRFYVTWHIGNQIQVSSSTDGLTWTDAVQVSDVGSFGIDSQIAVGPAGDVVIVWQANFDDNGAEIRSDHSTDGGQTWGTDVVLDHTSVASFNYVTPVSPNRNIWPSLSLAVDRSGGQFNGRFYIAFCDQADRDNNPDIGNDADRNDTEIFVRATDDGANWNTLGTNPVRVTDDTANSTQFFSWISVDPANGAVGIGWYDTRLDTGVPGSLGSTDNIPINEAHYFASGSVNGGANFLPNQRLSAGPTNANAAEPFNEFGDYSGGAMSGGVFYGVWSDNSNSTGNNPDGTGGLDVYIGARVIQSVIGASIDLQPNTATLAVGNTVNFVATVLDNQGNPLPGALVDFVVIGANPQTLQVVTNAQGQALFSYVGVNAGTDIVIASNGPISDQSTVTWLQSGTLSGFVYVDSNNNGLFDQGELPIPGVTVELTGTDIFGGATDQFAITDANGLWVFAGLLPGTYSVNEFQPNAYIDGIDTVGTCGGTVFDDAFTDIIITEGDICTDYLFGERGLRPEFISKRFFFSSTLPGALPGNITDPNFTGALFDNVDEVRYPERIINVPSMPGVLTPPVNPKKLVDSNLPEDGSSSATVKKSTDIKYQSSSADLANAADNEFYSRSFVRGESGGEIL